MPEFTLLPQDTTSLAGSRVTADCQARGLPEPYIIWTNGSRPVYESSRVKLAPNGSLVLLSVWESDAGSYTCRAANRAGAKEASIQIAVLPRRGKLVASRTQYSSLEGGTELKFVAFCSS